MLKQSLHKMVRDPMLSSDGDARLFVWLIIFAVVFWPEMVFAAETAAENLGQVICNVQASTVKFPRVLSAFSYVAGALMCARGVLVFRKHADNPSGTPMGPGIAQLVAAACLISLPWFAGVIQRTLFGTIGGGSAWNCTPGAVASVDASGLDVMLQNFVKNIHHPMMSLVALISVVVGLVYLVRALYKGAKVASGAQGADPKSIITHLVIGGILISTGTSFYDVNLTLFGGSSTVNMVTDTFTYSGISWSKLTSDTTAAANAKNTVNAALAFVQIIGIIAFVRGWMVLKAAFDGGGQATVPQGLTFVIGGVMAVNITKMIEVFDATFGTGLTS